MHHGMKNKGELIIKYGQEINRKNDKIFYLYFEHGLHYFVIMEYKTNKLSVQELWERS